MLNPSCNRLRSSFWGTTCPTRAQTVRSQARLCVPTSASLTGKGKRFPAELITVKKIMGEGSYGQVFEVAERAIYTLGVPPQRLLRIVHHPGRLGR